MTNPILQALNASKPNPLSNNSNNIMGLMNMLRTGNPSAIYQNMMNTNPQFKQFVEQNKGKSPEQIARENGIDPGILKLIR